MMYVLISLLSLRFRSMLLLTAAALVWPGNASAQTGDQPQPGFGARDIFAEYTLPPLQDTRRDPLWQSAQGLQVLVRARKLGWNGHSASEAWTKSEETYAHVQAQAALPAPAAPVVFRGTRASELNKVLAQAGGRNILVASSTLDVDTPIRIGGERVSLDLGNARLHSSAAMGYAIRVEHAADIRIARGTFRGEGWGVLVAGSKRVLVLATQMDGLTGGGVVITGSDDVAVWGSRFHALGAAPVLLHGSVQRAVVAKNEMVDNLGSSNWHAGVVVTDRNGDLAADPLALMQADNYWPKEQPIVTRLTVPMDNVIAYNWITGSQSSGVYSDGAARTVIVGNHIEGNSKEGLCLDNGSTANVVAFNVIASNGKRWGKSDAELKRDFVFNFGRLPDGSSPAKVPGISMDNAAYNEVMFNEVNGNYGGGIKMVRTAFYNTVGLNTLSDNNQGRSAHFHFFGVELGAARADAPVPELDFTPSRANQIFGNIIRGSHYAGIFFADGSDQNVVFDNSIFGATAWAMESVKRQSNNSFNNLTNLKLRNIGAGLDPQLLKLGAGQFDTP